MTGERAGLARVLLVGAGVWLGFAVWLLMVQDRGQPVWMPVLIVWAMVGGLARLEGR